MQFASIKFSLNAGSSKESISEKGAAHLLSFCGFEGTQKKSGLRLLREMENHAFVVSSKFDRQTSQFAVKAVPEFASEAISYLGEAVFSPPKHSYVVSRTVPSSHGLHINSRYALPPRLTRGNPSLHTTTRPSAGARRPT